MDNFAEIDTKQYPTIEPKNSKKTQYDDLTIWKEKNLDKKADRLKIRARNKCNIKQREIHYKSDKPLETAQKLEKEH